MRHLVGDTFNDFPDNLLVDRGLSLISMKHLASFFSSSVGWTTLADTMAKQTCLLSVFCLSFIWILTLNLPALVKKSK